MGAVERMNFVFELKDGIDFNPYKGKYFSLHGVRDIEDITPRYSSLILCSNRVWQEDENGVVFAKHCWELNRSNVDLKEFMWIKLQAQELQK